jgi:hypothetical protein
MNTGLLKELLALIVKEQSWNNRALFVRELYRVISDNDCYCIWSHNNGTPYFYFSLDACKKGFLDLSHNENVLKLDVYKIEEGKDLFYCEEIDTDEWEVAPGPKGLAALVQTYQNKHGFDEKDVDNFLDAFQSNVT